MRLKLIAAVALLAVGVGAIGLVLFAPALGASQAGSQLLTARATVTDVTQQAVATGNLAAGVTYGLSFGQAPQIVTTGGSGATNSSSAASTSSSNGGSSGSVTWPVQAVNVKAGDTVHKGDVLATADPAAAQLQLTVAQASLSAAQARLALDQAGATATDRAAAQLSIDQARQQLANAQQSRSDTLKQNQLSVQQAQAAVSAAKQQLAADQAAGAPASVISADEAAVAQAQQNYANSSAKAVASNHQAANSVTSAQLSLRSAQNGYAAKTQPANAATVASDTAAVASAQADVDSAERTVEHATLVAPADGTVTVVNVIAGFDAPSGYAVELTGGSLVVTAAFAETDMPALKTGQGATVTITSLGTTAGGTVSEIDPLAASSGSSSVVTYDVLVTLSDPPAAARPGMSVSVAVTTAQAANVLAVPAIALVGSAGNYEVRIVDGSGQAQLVPVQVGLVTSSMAQITGGLNQGETVVVGTSSQRTGTSGGVGFPGLLGGGGQRTFGNGPDASGTQAPAQP